MALEAGVVVEGFLLHADEVVEAEEWHHRLGGRNERRGEVEVDAGEVEANAEDEVGAVEARGQTLWGRECRPWPWRA